MVRLPHGYFDADTIARDLRRGGSTAAPRSDRSGRSRAASARSAAIAFCQGTPLRNEIEARDAARLGEATDAAAAAIAARFSGGALDAPVDGKIQALVVTVTAS